MLRFESHHCWSTHNEWHVQIPVFSHNINTSFAGWFNPASDLLSSLILKLQYALSLKSLPSSSFLKGALNLQSLFFLQCANFFVTCIESVRPAFFMATLSQIKPLFWWYTLNLKPTINWCKYQHSCTGTGHTLWIQLRTQLHVYKEVVIPTFCFEAKRADELAGELWPDKVHKEFLGQPCYLCIAHLFLQDLVRFRV